MKDLIKKYEVEIQSWHIFHDSVEKYRNALVLASSIATDMRFEIMKVLIQNPDHKKAKENENRVNDLIKCLDVMQGLGDTAHNKHVQLNKTNERCILLEEENKRLRNEINALKQNFENLD